FKYDPKIGSFKAWLLLNTRSRITERWRKKRLPIAQQSAQQDATAHTATIERIPDPTGQGFEEVWESEWKKSLLEQALEGVKREVSPKQYQIFDLYVLQGTPMEAITRALGVSSGQVYLAKHRISHILKDEMKKAERRLEGNL